MIRFELTDAEATTLQDVLDSYLSDLRMEIADTDQMEFRESLKARKKVIEDVIGRLSGGATRD